MNRWRQRLAEINGDASVAHVVHNVQNVQNVRSLRHFEQIGQIEQPPTTLPRTLKAAVQRWINDHFVPSSPGVCAHCGERPRPDVPFVLLFVGSDHADVHSSCHAAWRVEREGEAVAALGLKESA
jgi:hypothetical protein